MRFATDCRGRSSGRGLKDDCNDQRIGWRDERICVHLKGTHMCRQGKMCENVEREGERKKEMLVAVVDALLPWPRLTRTAAYGSSRSNRKTKCVSSNNYSTRYRQRPRLILPQMRYETRSLIVK